MKNELLRVRQSLKADGSAEESTQPRRDVPEASKPSAFASHPGYLLLRKRFHDGQGRAVQP